MSVQGEEGEIEEGEIGGGPPQQAKRRVVQPSKVSEGGVSFHERPTAQRGGGDSVSGGGSQSDEDGPPQQMFPVPPPPPPPPPPIQFDELMDRRLDLANRRFKDHSPKPRIRRSDIDMALEVHRRYPLRREIPPPPGRPWEHDSPPIDRHRRPDFSPEPRQRVRLLPDDRFRERHLPPFPDPPFRRPRPPPSPILYAPNSNPRRGELSPPRRDPSPPTSPRPSISRVDTEGKVVGKSTSQSSSESSGQNGSSSNEKSSDKNQRDQTSKEIGEVTQRSLPKSDSSNSLQRRLHPHSHFHEIPYHHRMSHYHHHHPHHHSHYMPRGAYRGYGDLSEFNEFDKRRFLRGGSRPHGFHNPYEYYRDGRGGDRGGERLREMVDRRRRYPYELDRVEELMEDIRILTDQVGVEDARKDLRGVCDRLVQAISKMEQLEPMLLKRYGAIRVQDVPNFSFISRRIFSGLKTLVSLVEHDDQPGQLSLISHTLHQAAEIKHKLLNIIDQKEFEELLSTCMAAASRRQHPSGSDSEGGSSSLSKRKERESSISKQNNNNQQKENESGKMEDADDADYADSKCPRYEKQEEEEDDEEMSFPKGFGLHASERENGNVNENVEKRNFESFSIPNRILKPNEESIQGSSNLRIGSIPLQKLSLKSQFDQETESLEDVPIPPNRTTPPPPQIKWVPNKDPRLSSIVEKQDLNSQKQIQNQNQLNQIQSKQQQIIYEHEMPCEEPVTPESMIDEEQSLSQENDREIVLVFPPESPVTSPLDSYNMQYDQYEYQYNKYNNYEFNDEISLKKSFNVVIQIEGVLFDIIDCSTAKNLLGFATEKNFEEFTQNCLLSEEVLLYSNQLVKLRPGVKENIQKWEQQNIFINFYSQLCFAQQILEFFQFDFNKYQFFQNQQEVENFSSDCGEILWVGHTQPLWLPTNQNIKFLRIMGYSYFPKNSDSQINPQNFYHLKADENRQSNAMTDLSQIFHRLRYLFIQSPLFSLFQCLKALKERVLQGIVLVININENTQLKYKFSEIGQQLGAQIVELEFLSQATHVIVVNCQSRNQVTGIEDDAVKVVDGSWLLCCEVRMKRADEELFIIN